MAAQRKQAFEQNGQWLAMTPTERAQWEQDQNKWKAQQEATKWEQGYKDRALNQQDELTRMRRGLDNQERADRLTAQRSGRIGQFISTSYENAIKRQLSMLGDLEELTPEQKADALAQAPIAALRELGPRLLSAAQAAGIKLERDPAGGFIIDGQKFTNPDEANMYLLGQLGG
jgi:hypothetical protein